MSTSDVAQGSTERQLSEVWDLERGVDPKWPDWVCIRIGTKHLSGHVGRPRGHQIAAVPDMLSVLNELHDSFDQQLYQEMSRLENDALPDHEFSVNVTAKQLRAINQAILKAEGKS